MQQLSISQRPSACARTPVWVKAMLSTFIACKRWYPGLGNTLAVAATRRRKSLSRGRCRRIRCDTHLFHCVAPSNNSYMIVFGGAISEKKTTWHKPPYSCRGVVPETTLRHSPPIFAQYALRHDRCQARRPQLIVATSINAYDEPKIC